MIDSGWYNHYNVSLEQMFATLTIFSLVSGKEI